MSRGLAWLWEMLFPRRCMLCRRFLAKNETDLCHQCFSDAPIYPFGSLNPDKSGKINTQFLDSFTAVWYYEEDVRRSILRYKFRRGVFLAPKFGRMVAMKLLQQEMEQADVLTWVPVSAIRRFRRGYDQCQLLARQVGGELGLPAVCTLRKIRNTPPQSGLSSASQRKANILGAYRVREDVNLRGKTVLLLDDIFTTGSTMNECARVLLTAGAKEVHGAAIAVARNRRNP